MTACSLGDFDSLGVGSPDAGSGGSGGSSGSGGGGTGGDGGTSGDGGNGGTSDGGSGGTSGSSGSAGLGGSGGTESLPPQEGNLLENPDFDNGASRWVPVGPCSTSLSDMNPRSGSSCLLTTGRSDLWMGPGYTVTSILYPGSTYIARAWVRLADLPGDAGPPPSQEMGFTLKTFCDSDPEPVYAQKPNFLVTTEWTEVTTTFTVPDCVSTDSILYIERAAIGVDFYIDDTSLEALVE